MSSNKMIARGLGLFCNSSIVKFLRWSCTFGLRAPGLLCAASRLDLANNNSRISRDFSISFIFNNTFHKRSSKLGSDLVFDGGIGAHVPVLSLFQLVVDAIQ